MFVVEIFNKVLYSAALLGVAKLCFEFNMNAYNAACHLLDNIIHDKEEEESRIRRKIKKEEEEFESLRRKIEKEEEEKVDITVSP